jgi:hypothetical protein
MAMRTSGFVAGMATTFLILAPARVVLPAPAEAAEQPLAAAPARASASPAVRPDNDVQQEAAEKDKQAERAERRKAEAQQRERAKRIADQKTRREAARKAKQQLEDQQQRQQPGVMAFGDDEQPRTSSLFSN